MAATNVQAFSGDVEISSNLTAASSKFSLDTNGTLKQFGAGLNNNYIKLMKYFPSGSNWKIATGSYTGNSWQWLSICAKMTRLNEDVKTIQFNYFGDGGTSRVRDSIVIGGDGSDTQPNEIKVYNKTSNSTYEIYLQIDSATSVEVEITHRGSTIDDDYSTVATANNGAIVETGLTKIYDSGTTTDLRLKEGNVGIGTTIPQDVTHIWKDGANDAHGLLIEQNNSGTGSATLKFGVAYTDESTAGLSKAGIFFKRADTNGRGDLLFCMDNADDTNDVDTSNHALTIYRDGNVGIGTNDPGEALHVAGNIRLGAAEGVDDDNFKSIVTTSPLVIHSNADDLDGLGATLNLRSGFNDSESNIMMLSSRSNSNFQYISFATATQERMRIKYNGNVGIGVTNPGEKLEIVEGGSIKLSSNQNYSTAKLYIDRIGTAGWGTVSLYNAFRFFETRNTSLSENFNAVKIGASGIAVGYDPPDYTRNATEGIICSKRVAIGRSTADHPLDVSGTVRATLFAGSGASLTSLNAGYISSGTLAVARGGSGATSTTGTAGHTVLSASPSLTGRVVYGSPTVLKLWNAFNNNTSAGDYTFTAGTVQMIHFHYSSGEDPNISENYLITTPQSGTPIVVPLRAVSGYLFYQAYGGQIVRFWAQNLPSNYNGVGFRLRSGGFWYQS